MSKAFVAGATGYTGRAVVAALRNEAIDTVAHVRPDSSRRDAWQQRFGELGATVDLTPWEPDALTETLARTRPSLVFALLGTTRARAKAEAQKGQSASTYDSVDYSLTAMLIEAARSVEPRPRFIYLSSAGVPETEPRSGSYMHARWHVEQDLRSSDLLWVSVRPSIITGDDRDDARPGERAAAVVLDGALTMAGALGMKRLRERYRSTTNEALARALVRIGLDEGIARRVVESEELR